MEKSIGLTRQFVKRSSRYAALPETKHTGAHMVRTEAQDLDEALDIIAMRKRRKPFKRFKPRGVPSLQEQLGFYKRPKNITLPKLKFLEITEP